MKVFVLILCVSLAALANGLTEEQKERIRGAYKSCQSDPATSIDLELLKTTRDPSKVPNFGAHSLCVTKKLDLQNENGDINKDTLKSRLAEVLTDEAKINKTVEDCAVQRATPEETAARLLKCLHDQGILRRD
nr:odorant binding protein [Semanotus bifasciatus]